MLIAPLQTRIRRRRAKINGFTLIELLMVISVILILAGITFGIARGVQNAQARSQAKAEMAVIAQALESYKSKYGDYPWVSLSSVNGDQEARDASHGLMKALVGWQSVDGTQDGALNSDGILFNKQPSIVDVSKLTLSSKWPPEGAGNEVSPVREIYFIDPWGNPYIYIYKDPANQASWDRFGYVLFSKGGDGRASSAGISETTGDIDASFRDQEENLDNIYYGE